MKLTDNEVSYKTHLIYKIPALLLILINLCHGACVNYKNTYNPPPADQILFSCDFNEGFISQDLWVLTKMNDFNVSLIDVEEESTGQYRLKLLANTIGTKSQTVKHLGIRSRNTVNLIGEQAVPTSISFTIDWNNQKNGCYLSAGLFLCPTAVSTNPNEEKNWLAVEYIGVPPGENARLQVSCMKKAVRSFLYQEDWPKNRTGRKISKQTIRIIINGPGLTIIENDKQLFTTDDHRLTTQLQNTYIYLQLKTHSNYPERIIYFDDILVKRGFNQNPSY